MPALLLGVASMSRPLGPYQYRPLERRELPEDLRLFHTTWPRRREYLWAAIAAALSLYLAVVGPLAYEAERVSATIAKEEVALRAPTDGTPFSPHPFVGDPRELHRLQFSAPLACQPPKAQWVRQWGDGRTPYEPHPRTRQRPWVCVNADLRRKTHVP